MVLSLILKKPMCGKDVIELIYNETGILLSSGTVYPVLNLLKSDGYLECKIEAKKKVFKPADEAKIQGFLETRRNVNEVVMQLLRGAQ